MEVNNMVIAVFSIFLAILFTVNMINNYEQAASHIEAKKAYLEIDNSRNFSTHENKKNTYLKGDHELLANLVKNLSEFTENNSNNSFDSGESVWTKEKFGKYGWTLLHVYSANYPTEPTQEDMEKMKIFLYLFGYFFPCKVCGKHFLSALAANPVNVTSRAGLMEYFCHLHNDVNHRLNKTAFDCQTELYKTYGGDCGCGDDNEDSSLESNNNTTIDNKTDNHS